MICLIPLADGQMIDHEVLKGLCDQTIKISIISISRPEDHYYFPTAPKDFLKLVRPNRKSITETRNLLKDHALKRNDDFFLYLDSDVVLTSKHDIEDLLIFIKTHHKIGVVGLNTKQIDLKNIEKPDHIPMACLLFRKDVLKDYIFHNGKHKKSCNCKMLVKDIRKMPHPEGGFWEIRYLDYRKLREIPRK